MRKILLYSALALVVGFVLIQLIPVVRSNPPVEVDIPTAPEVKVVLRRACYDCHSHETVWPWYSHIAPVSWLLVRDVRAGRRELNFSTWNRYDARQQDKKLQESWRKIAANKMPPWLYTVPHPQARLSAEDRRLLRAWTAPWALALHTTRESVNER